MNPSFLTRRSSLHGLLLGLFLTTIVPNIFADDKTALDYLRSGLTWYTKGEYDKAIKDFDEAIRLNPKDARPVYFRGGAWSAKKGTTRPSRISTRRFDLTPTASAHSTTAGLRISARRISTRRSGTTTRPSDWTPRMPSPSTTAVPPGVPRRTTIRPSKTMTKPSDSNLMSPMASTTAP
jgi:Tetratricopeptide repeat